MQINYADSYMYTYNAHISTYVQRAQMRTGTWTNVYTMKIIVFVRSYEKYLELFVYVLISNMTFSCFSKRCCC